MRKNSNLTHTDYRKKRLTLQHIMWDQCKKDTKPEDKGKIKKNYKAYLINENIVGRILTKC